MISANVPLSQYIYSSLDFISENCTFRGMLVADVN